MNKRICTIEGCGKKHEARGYCKSHYKSFRRYGNPIQVDLNNAARKEDALRREELAKKGQLTGRGTERWAYPTDGICSVDGCESPIKARRMCDMHYTRQRRNGTIERKIRSGPNREIEDCLVIGCENEHYSMGYCSTHRSYELKYGSPYLPKVIKLCGVHDCYERHFGKGLCKKHLREWRRDLKLYGLE